MVLSKIQFQWHFLKRMLEKLSCNHNFFKQPLRSSQTHSNSTISACFHVAEAAKSAYYLWGKYGFIVNLYNFLQFLCLYLKKTSSFKYIYCYKRHWMLTTANVSLRGILSKVYSSRNWQKLLPALISTFPLQCKIRNWKLNARAKFESSIPWTLMSHLLKGHLCEYIAIEVGFWFI